MNTKKIASLLALTTLAIACQQNHLPDEPQQPNGAGEAIVFDIQQPAINSTTTKASQTEYIDLLTALPQPQTQQPATKATPNTGNNIADGSTFGVLAYLSENNNLTKNYFYNKKVTRLGDNYIYNDPEYWPEQPLRFFAYAPYSDQNDTLGIRILEQSLANIPSIEFSVKPDVRAQRELLLASTPQMFYSPTVKLSFDHSLTQVNFLFKKQNIIADVKVLSVTLQNVLSRGIVSLQKQPSGLYLWTADPSSATSYRLSIDNGLLVELDAQNINDVDYSNITTNDGALMMIPQPITEGGYLLLVEYTIGGVVKYLDATLPEAIIPNTSGSWDSGRKLNYLVILAPQDPIENVIVDVQQGSSNSFMLNPSPRIYDNTTHTNFELPIVRVNEFYNNVIYSWMAEPLTGIEPTDHWGVEIVWMSRSNLLTLNKKNGIGIDDRFSIMVRVATRGNAVVGIFKDSDQNGIRSHNEPLLWSWHIWLTDYEPTVFSSAQPGTSTADGQWPVKGGYVFRYRDGNFGNSLFGAVDPWKPFSGTYSAGAIMDRNLGATNANFPRLENAEIFEYANLSDRNRPLDVLYYQYGRKDPIPSNASRFRANGTPLPKISIIQAPVPVKETINDPQILPVNSTTWASDAPVIPTHWFDRDAPAFSNEYKPHKSIFDPCPYGWQLPANGTWSDFSNATITFENFTARYSVASSLSTNYHLSGYRDPLTGTVTQVGYQSLSWSDSPYNNETESHYLFLTSPQENPFEPIRITGLVAPSRLIMQTAALTVRCVRY